MPDDARDILRNLIETCRDGETGYLHAAGLAADSQLKSYFQQQSLERARLRVELDFVGKTLSLWTPDHSEAKA